MPTWFEKRLVPIILLICCVGGIAACTTGEQSGGAEQSQPPSANINTEQPSVFPVNTAPVTRTLAYSSGEQTAIDIAMYDDTTYILQDNGVQLFANGMKGAFITLANETDAVMTPRCLAVSEDGLFVAYLDELDCIVLSRYTFGGQFAQAYSAVEKSFHTSVYDLAVKDGIAYVSMWKSGNASLYICDLAANTLTNTDVPAGRFCLIDDNQIIFSNVSDYRATNYGVYDIQTGSYELIDTGKAYRLDSFAFDASSGLVYAGGYEPLSYSTSNPCSLGNFIAVINIPGKTVERVVPVKDKNSILAFTGNDLLLLESKQDLIVYNNPDGYRGQTHTPLQVLYYDEDTGGVGERCIASFADIHAEVQFALWEQYNFSFLDVEITPQSIPLDSAGNATIRFAPPEGTYDLILMASACAALLNNTDGMVDLGENEPLQESFAKMLPGIEELCTIDGKLLGVPVYVLANGYKHNRTIPLTAGQEPLGFGWTIQDYYEYAKAVGSNDPAKLAFPDNLVKFSDLISTVFSGRHIPVEDYASFMRAYHAIFDEGLYDTRDPSLGDVSTRFLHNAAISTTSIERSKESGRIMEMRISENSRFPVGMGMLVANKSTEKLDIVLTYLQAFVNPDVTYRAHNGTAFDTSDMTICPIWYYSDELWEADPYLENYAYMLANSVTKQGGGLHEDRPRNYAFIQGMRDAIGAVENGELPPEDAAEKLFALQEEYLAGTTE